jgi:two-component system OmpR family sensor kinase
MASLRARLTAALLGVAAVGMLLLGAITYAEQRSFLLDRIDNQARSAIAPVGNTLDERGIGRERARGGAPPGGPRGGPGRGHGPGAGGPRGRPEGGLPDGIYGERRDVSGKLLGEVVLDPFEQGITADPKIPAGVEAGDLLTVDGEKGDPERYRVYAESTRGAGGLTIVAVPMREADQTLRRLLVVEALVIAAMLALLAVVAWLVARLGLAPLDRIGHTAGRIAGGDLSHRVESTDPRTEVGRLGIALNRMLDRLQEAFEERQASENRLRQFLSDASHELRTPLASVRGYAELFRMGAAREPDEIDKAMRRIEEEAARMGVLVEDLLSLARLDEVADAPHVPVELSALVRDAVDDARATAPARKIAADLDGPVEVLGDAFQLRQILANLLRNALVHTPERTPIEVRLGSEGGTALIEVRDHGPGLPTEDGAALFERFWRAEGGRERGRAGSGLGLAIVAAIVAAHDGRVSASNAPGGGASFVVRLPTRPVAQIVAGTP